MFSLLMDLHVTGQILIIMSDLVSVMVSDRVRIKTDLDQISLYYTHKLLE